MLLKKRVEILELIYNCPGDFCEETIKASEDIEFKRIDLHYNLKVVSTDRDKFFIVDNLLNRFIAN